MESTQVKESPVPLMSSQCDIPESQESKINVSLGEAEKSALQDLNDRLAMYVDTVRQWGEPAFPSLDSSQPTEESIVSKNIEKLRYAYDTRLIESKEILETTRKENVRLKSEIENVGGEKDKLEKKCETLASEIDKLKSELAKVDEEFLDQTEKLQKLTKELDKSKKEFSKVKSQLTILTEIHTKQEAKIGTLVKKCSSLESEKESLEEELKFKDEVHHRELETAYEAVNDLKQKSINDDSRTYDELGQLRRELQEELNYAKHNVVASFKSRLEKAEAELFETKQDLNELQKEHQSVQVDNGRLRVEVEASSSKAHVLELRLEQSTKEYETQIKSLLNERIDIKLELEEANAKLHNLMFDYHETIGHHLTLDTEINAYRCLLDSEEKRLGLAGRKRTHSLSSKRFQLSVSSGKNLKFASLDEVHALFIVIVNDGKKVRTLSSYKLKVSQTIHPIPKSSVHPGESLIVYTGGYDGTIETNSIVLQGLNTLEPKTGSETRIALLDNKDQIVSEGVISATLNLCTATPKEKVRKSSIYCKPYSPGFSPIRTKTALASSSNTPKFQQKNSPEHSNSCIIT